MEVLQNREFDVNWSNPDKDGCTYLMAASENGHVNVVAYLLRKGAIVDKVDKEGCTALWCAVQKHNHAEASRLLLEHGADPNCQPYDEENYAFPLYNASANNHPEVCELLLKYEANIEQKCDGKSSLQIATELKHTNIIQILEAAILKKNDAKRRVIIANVAKAKVEQEKKEMCQDLFYHAAEGELTEFKRVAGVQTQKFDINWANEEDGFTFLIVASNNGHANVVEYLLGKRAIVDKRNKIGMTALWAAVTSNHMDTARLLLEKGADPNCQPYDEDKYSIPLFHAASKNYPEVCELLLTYDANVKLKFIGYTALQIATQKKNTKIVKILQAAIDKTTKKGQKNEAKSGLIAPPDDGDKKLPPPSTGPAMYAAVAVAAADAVAVELLAGLEAEEKAKADKTAKSKAIKDAAAKKKMDVAEQKVKDEEQKVKEEEAKVEKEKAEKDALILRQKQEVIERLAIEKLRRVEMEQIVIEQAELERIRLEREEQERREQEIREQESLQAALEESRREQERIDELRRESLRIEARQRLTVEEAGRKAQQKLLEEANSLKAERIAEESLLKSIADSKIVYDRLRSLKSNMIGSHFHEPAASSAPLSPPSRAELEAQVRSHDSQLIAHKSEIADLKRQARTSDREIADLKRQNEKFERQNEKFERQIRELTNHLSASSSFAESPDISVAHEPRNRSDSLDGCVICFGPNNVLLLPCKHPCLCRECSATKVVDQCPICSAEVQSKMNIFN